MDSRMRESDREIVHDQAVPGSRQHGGVPMQSNGKAWKATGSACHDWAMSAANDVAQDVAQWSVITHVKRGT